MNTDQNLTTTLLINSIHDCILSNHLGPLTDHTLFASFENMCYLLAVNYQEIDPDLLTELDNCIKSVIISDFNSLVEFEELLYSSATSILPDLQNIVQKYSA